MVGAGLAILGRPDNKKKCTNLVLFREKTFEFCFAIAEKSMCMLNLQL